MKRGALLAVLALLFTTVLASNADASRRSSLAGNLLIEDVQDIFFMPHEVVNYVNYVWFDFVTGVDLPSASLPAVTDGGGGGGGGGTDVPDDITDGMEGTPVGTTTTSGLGGPHLGSGGILFGNAVDRNFGFGIALHRSDYQSAQLDASGLGTVFHLHRNAGLEDAYSRDLTGSSALLLPIEGLNWLDLLVGFSLNQNMDIGARVALGSNVLSRADLDGDDQDVINPGASTTFFSLIASLGYDTSSMAIDASVELNIGSWSAQSLAGDNELEDSASMFGLGVMARGFFAMSDSIDLGALFNFYTRSRSTNLDDGDSDDSTRTDVDISEFGVRAGVGPRYQIGDNATVAAYVTLGLGQLTADPEGKNNLIDQVTVLLPGVNVAAEWHLLHWLTYRAGIRSEYSLVSGELQEDSDRGGDSVSMRGPSFYWSNGFGFNALEGNFKLDAMLNWPVITAGPYLISGSAADMFASVSASYTF